MDDSGPFSNSPPDPELSLYNTFTELLKAAQKEGPGKEKYTTDSAALRGLSIQFNAPRSRSETFGTGVLWLFDASA
jgi:hypothetical protein